MHNHGYDLGVDSFRTYCSYFDQQRTADWYVVFSTYDQAKEMQKVESSFKLSGK